MLPPLGYHKFGKSQWSWAILVSLSLLSLYLSISLYIYLIYINKKKVMVYLVLVLLFRVWTGFKDKSDVTLIWQCGLWVLFSSATHGLKSLRVRLVHDTAWDKTGWDTRVRVWQVPKWDTLELGGTHIGQSIPHPYPYNTLEQTILDQNTYRLISFSHRALSPARSCLSPASLTGLWNLFLG